MANDKPKPGKPDEPDVEPLGGGNGPPPPPPPPGDEDD